MREEETESPTKENETTETTETTESEKKKQKQVAETPNGGFFRGDQDGEAEDTDLEERLRRQEEDIMRIEFEKKTQIGNNMKGKEPMEVEEEEEEEVVDKEKQTNWKKESQEQEEEEDERRESFDKKSEEREQEKEKEKEEEEPSLMELQSTSAALDSEAQQHPQLSSEGSGGSGRKDSKKGVRAVLAMFGLVRSGDLSEVMAYFSFSSKEAKVSVF